MTRTAADMLVDRLIDWEVTAVFGLPGDGINGIMEALRTRKDRISFDRLRAVRRGVRRYRVSVRAARRGTARARSHDARGRSRAVRSGRGSVRAAHAGPCESETGAAHGRIAGPWRAEPRAYRAHPVPRQGERFERKVTYG